MSNILNGPINIYFSYAHKDERYLHEIENSLAGLRHRGIITWHDDRSIDAGENWKGTVDKQINTASIILLLISPDYIASDYCYSIEMRRALERHERGEARVVPILIRPTNTYGAPFENIRALPTNGRAISQWKKRDEGFLNVAQGIQKIIEEVQVFNSNSNRTSEVYPIWTENKGPDSNFKDILDPTLSSPQAVTDAQPSISYTSQTSSPSGSSPSLQTSTINQTSQNSQIAIPAQNHSPTQTSTPQNSAQEARSSPSQGGNPLSSTLLLPRILKRAAPDAMRVTSDKAVRKLSEDKLGFTTWVKALRNFIVSQDTTTPLTIGIDGAWGTGKTSFMYMLQNMLEPSFTFREKVKDVAWPWFK